MAAAYQVNITIAAGVDFAQEYTVTHPDQSAVDITGYKFYANLAKHPNAIDAALSTSGTKVYEYIPFSTIVNSGVDGKYAIALTSSQTSKLSEGKYVYNVVMQDLNGEKTSVVTGLAFVEVAFGALI